MDLIDVQFMCVVRMKMIQEPTLIKPTLVKPTLIKPTLVKPANTAMYFFNVIDV